MSLFSPRVPGRRLLHSPGPTPLPDAVLHALMHQPMDMGDPRVDETIAACEAGLKALLQTTEADVFFYACNGHGAWEAVVENIVPPGGLVLVPGTGHFSESWAAQTEALGRRVCRTPWVEGWPIDAAAVTQALLDDSAHEIVAVFVVHTDTSSGITSDIAALRAPSMPRSTRRCLWWTWWPRSRPSPLRWTHSAWTWPWARRKKA
jgi:alanine-glyoxylate transaminase/serine-glyoxylate transaminase/serine-pyruvate transaminase